MEATEISEEVHQKFLHIHLSFESEELFNEFVRMPAEKDDVLGHSQKLVSSGMPAAFRSTDAVNTVIDRCTYKLTLGINKIYYNCKVP